MKKLISLLLIFACVFSFNVTPVAANYSLDDIDNSSTGSVLRLMPVSTTHYQMIEFPDFIAFYSNVTYTYDGQNGNLVGVSSSSMRGFAYDRSQITQLLYENITCTKRNNTITVNVEVHIKGPATNNKAQAFTKSYTIVV